MNLYIMQHGPALPQEVKANQPLSPVGRDQMAAVARAMRIMSLRFDAILASPVHPAVQTAQILAEGLGYAPRSVTRFPALQAGTDADTCLAALRECERFKSVLIVGELPLLAEVASRLLTEGPELQLDMSGAALAAFSVSSVESHDGVLLWLLRSQQLQMIAAA